MNIGQRTGKEIWYEINEYSDSNGEHDWDDVVFIPLSEARERYCKNHEMKG